MTGWPAATTAWATRNYDAVRPEISNYGNRRAYIAARSVSRGIRLRQKGSSKFIASIAALTASVALLWLASAASKGLPWAFTFVQIPD
jgi:hypothetical protein